MQPLEMDGFWIPKALRAQLLDSGSAYGGLTFLGGRECPPGTPGAVHARWPRLEAGQWRQLLTGLRANRPSAPHGEAYWERLQFALRVVGGRLSDPQDPLHQQAMRSLPIYSGYSEAMIRCTLNALEMVSLADIPQAFQLRPTRESIWNWQSMAPLTGWLRFFPQGVTDRLVSQIPGTRARSLFGPPTPPAFVTGYGAGNVPGSALLIALLANSLTLEGDPPPVTVIKNSRREPIFSALVLSALEAVDPQLFASLAVLVWDTDDRLVQELLLPHSDLLIAAASDDTIAQIQTQFTRYQPNPGARFHAHGHKVSFTAISAELLGRALVDPSSGAPMLDILTLLAGLDSVFWDQHGCLSARIHFVEDHATGGYSALDYAWQLSAQLGLLAKYLPRGHWPRRHLHQTFDRYKTLEATGQVQVCSAYADEYVVVFDRRELDTAGFYRQVNECQGRVVVVRPVEDLMEVPRRYLRCLPAENLQSLSVALGRPEAPLSQDHWDFFQSCGKCGVTAIRSVGRGAFPQLAYSWDGFLPLDLTRPRPAGHFTTIEFEQSPYRQILETYHRLVEGW